MEDEHCKGCDFYACITGKTRYCKYYLTTGNRRPCPAGEGCTVRVPKKKKEPATVAEDPAPLHLFYEERDYSGLLDE